ncbi:MAG TPA: hypothetical protein VJ302_10640 [Blastocatellia bacterium]|nr:hypothetical protein [Blastocatellia bacterium]
MLRHRQSNGQLKHRTLLTPLEPDQVWAILGRSQSERLDAATILVADAELCDLRGGTVEIEFKEDKQGLRIERRNKKRFAAQQMVMLLGTLAHKVIVWAKRWLMEQAPRPRKYGVLRLVRDLFQISGTVEFDQQERVIAIKLNRAAMLARPQNLV